MRRRGFIALVGGAAALWSQAASAQNPGGMRRIGVLLSLAESDPEGKAQLSGFTQALAELGWIDGHNLRTEVRWGHGNIDRIRILAKELVARVAMFFNPDTAPGGGALPSLNHPGGNVTGMSLFPSELAGKSVQLLKRLLPSATQIGFLVNPSSPGTSVYTSEASAAAKTLGISIQVLNASTEQELEEVFASLPSSKTSGLAIPAEPFFDSQRDRIVALAARYSVPAIYSLQEYAAAGGLMSYGTSLPDTYRRAAIYVGRVLKGEKPADLPVMQPTKYDLVLNMKTAKLLALSDEVIE